MDADTRTRLTFAAERRRAVAAGAVETAGATFLLLIAVSWFDAGPLAKGLVAAGSGLGYLIAPLTVTLAERSGLPVGRTAARLLVVGSAALGLAALIPHVVVFVTASVIALSAAGALIPLLTQIYQDNYPAESRGRYFAHTSMVRIVSAVIFSWVGGLWLSADLADFQGLLAVFAIAMGYSAWCLARIPSRPLATTGDHHVLRALRSVRDDRVFRVTLVSWMFMGFANLVMLPLRIEYLANPIYGLSLDPNGVALLTGVVPNIARLAMTPLWGRLFDRANFFVLRMCLNAGFALGIVSFFSTDSMLGLLISAVTFGISTAGGDVAWSLWVTKVAPPERVADYMSVHTFLTGVRALTAPLLAFAVVSRWSMTSMGWASAAAIGLATLLLVPEARRGGLRGAASPPIAPPLPADEGEP